MKRRKSVAAATVLVALVATGSLPASAQLTIGGGVNQGCIAMRITYSTCGIIPYPCAT